MKNITFSLCAFVLLAFGSRRGLQSAPWDYDVEQLSGSCEQADETFHKLWNDARNLCSATINRMNPPSICKQQNSESCPPGVETDCPDADPFNKVCVVNFETCERSLSSQLFKTILKLLGPIGELSDVADTALKGASAGVTIGIMAGDIDAQINYGKAVEESKLSFRKLFHDFPDMLMELVEYQFAQSDQREQMSEDWSKISARTQKTILAHACRLEADKALRYVNFDLLMEDLKSKSTFYDVWLNNQASCLFGTGDAENLSLDCLNKVSSFIGIFDPTGISTLVGLATELDFCPDINDRNDPHYNPRNKLDKDHPWHLVKERLAESLRVSEVTNQFRVENSRGDGESMSHQLKRKMLSQACPTEYQFSKGVCRPVSINQFKNWGKNLVHYHDTRPQLIFVDEGSESHDQCCDKEGTTAIRDERDCRRAAQEVRPWARYIGTVSKDTIPYGCYADIRTENVGFNTNRSNKRLEGFYEPICRAGKNQYKIPEFNVIRVGRSWGYVMGDLGQSCPQDQAIVRRSDCRFAIHDLAPDKISIPTPLEGNTEIMGGCSLKQDEVRSFYNDKHPTETDIPDNDPGLLFYPAAGSLTCELDLNEWCASNTPFKYARFDRSWKSSKKQWRCYSTGALTADTFHVNTDNMPFKNGGTCTSGISGGTPDPLDATCWNHWTKNSELSRVLEDCGTPLDCKFTRGRIICRQLKDGGARVVPTLKGGSYPICYAKGVRSSELQPIQERRIRYTDRYAFKIPDCPRGYYHTENYKDCSAWNCLGCYCAECFQPYWSCGDNRDAILVEGRKVPSNEILPVAYCLDSKALGHS